MGHFTATRQENLYRGSMPRLAVDDGATARLLGKAVHHGESQAAAFTHFLGRVERLEDVVQNLGGHADASVGDRQDHIFTRAQFPLARHIAFVQGLVGGRDDQLAAIRHGISRIDGQVQQGVFHLTMICQCVPQARRRVDSNLDGLAEGALQQMTHAMG